MGSFLKVKGILKQTLDSGARRLVESRNRVPTLTFGSPYGGLSRDPSGGTYVDSCNEPSGRKRVRVGVRRGWTR